MKMLNNNIRVDGVTVGAPMRRRKRALALDFCEHRLCTRAPFTGGWKNADNYCLKVKSEYMKTKCAHCQKKVRTYCKCDEKVTLCSECYAAHVLAHGNTN